MDRDMEKLRAITNPNKDIYMSRLAESAVKDNLYNRGYRDGYNAAQKEIADQYVHFMEMNFSKKEEKQ